VAHTLPNIYDRYQEEEDGDLTYKEFSAACSEFNIAAMERILEGEELNMGHRLSTLSVIRIKRDFKNPNVNWPASFELKEQIIEEGGTPKSDENPDGEEWLVYYDDPWYARFYWQKSRCQVPNKTAYSFRATRGDKGNKTKLHELLEENKENDGLAHLNFELVEHISSQ